MDALLAALPEATLVVGPHGAIRHANLRALRLLGLDVGDRLADAVAEPAELTRALSGWRGTLQMTPAKLRVRGRDGAVHVRCDGAALRPTGRGEEPLVLIRLRPHDAAVGRFRELTERVDALTVEIVRRRAAEEEANTEREWLQVTLASIGDGVITTDPQGTVTFINPAAERYTGWSNERAIGRPLSAVFHIVNEQTREPVENPVARVIEGGRVVGLANHTVLLRPDGTELPIADSAAPIRDPDGTLGGVVLVFQDESARRFHERGRERLLRETRRAALLAEDAAKTKDQLIAAISHELRTPLAAIIGWSEAMASGEVEPDEHAKAVDVILRNARVQKRLIDDLLDASQAVVGALQLELAPTDVTEVVRAAIDSVAHAAAQRHVEVVAKGVDRSWPLRADGQRLQQALWNVLWNAVKFSEPGTRVEVEVGRRSSRLRVEVRDQGIGLDDEQLAHLFEPFWQARRRNAGADRGMGLGLSIALRIVEAHGGRLLAASEGLGRGATFTLELPVAVLSDAPPSGEVTLTGPARTPRLRLEHVRVLVVEDETDSREVLELILGTRGATVRSAEDAATALKTLDRWIPDIVLSDIAMPDVDGYELMAAIRARPSDRGGDLPAIALTAFTSAADVQRAMDAGFCRHLSKPATPDQIAETIVELLGDHVAA